MAENPRIFHLLQQANSSLFCAVDGHLRTQEDIVSAHQVILFVLTQEDGLQSSDLAVRAGMSPSRLTGLVDTMVTKDLVRREQAPDDGRVQKVFITPKGADIIKRTKARARELNEDLLSPFNEAERQTISDFLHHVMKVGKRMSDTSGGHRE